MKSILFASTALVAFAGAAAAQGVALSGSAEMGIQSGSGGVANTGDEIEFFTDIDVTFTMSGETDNGLTFGASIDLDESDGANAAQGTSNAFADNVQGGETIFLSGNFGTITAGDTDGAFDWALTEVGMGSSINDDHTEHAGYNGNSGLDGTYDGQIVRYDYAIADFAFAVSAELPDDGGVGNNDAVFGIGFTYNLNLGGTDLGVGLGYQTTQVAGVDRDIVGVSLSAGFGAISTALNFSQREVGNVETDHVGIGVGYTSGAITVAANYGQFDTAGVDTDGFGLAASYDLGGGASVQFGYGDSNFAGGVGDFETFSLGVAMSF